jgi:hypothetical protein
MPKICSVDGCDEQHDAKGFCAKHYQKFKRHGNPLVSFRAKNGSGGITKGGYRLIRFNGASVYEHIHKAEIAINKKLPSIAVVHHVNGDKKDNRNTNLIICGSEKYHRLLHMRTNALNNGKPAHYRKCPFCKRYDDPSTMVKVGTISYGHRKCANDDRKSRKQRSEA